MAITLPKIQENVQALLAKENLENFIYDFLKAYGFPNATIVRLKSGTSNKSKTAGEVLLTGKIFFKTAPINDDTHDEIMEISRNKTVAKNKPMFIMILDEKQRKICAFDNKHDDFLDIDLEDLYDEYTFFRPLAGYEKSAMGGTENIADVRASEKMAKLYDRILQNNQRDDEAFGQDLNIFLCRLLFCFFAEDTGVFPTRGCFTTAIKDHTKPDGNDLSAFIESVFNVLSQSNRSNVPKALAQFPYVNGGLFAVHHDVPSLDAKARTMMIDCGNLDWAEINPDIFGSMMQSVADAEKRSSLGMHYTSPDNIMKVINPLFLDDYLEEYYRAKNDENRLYRLLDRLKTVKIFDPACGSGNFLILAYKNLRMLEMKILKSLEALRIDREKKAKSGKGIGSKNLFMVSEIKLSQFYGIEIDHFAHEVAMLSLWLVEHQMNLKFDDEFGVVTPRLPLRDSGNIVCGNACRLDWEEVCPKGDGEVFILGNPPYLGDKLQSKTQKEDLKLIFDGVKNAKAVDYIAAWFIKASNYIGATCKYAFVTTNSICQGVQVPILWKEIFKRDQEIFFSYNKFNWQNKAKNGATVICSIIGVRSNGDADKYHYGEQGKLKVSNINAYLIPSKNNIIVEKHSVSISKLPIMFNGNIPRDSGNFMLLKEDKDFIINHYPISEGFIKEIVGSKEFIQGIERWCLWIEDDQVDIAWKIPEVADRLKKIRDYRIRGSDRGKLGIDTPHKFERTLRCNEYQLTIPRVSSERRTYGVLSEKTHLRVNGFF